MNNETSRIAGTDRTISIKITWYDPECPPIIEMNGDGSTAPYPIEGIWGALDKAVFEALNLKEVDHA